MTKTFGEYLTEAVQRGWWGGLNRPGQAVDPQVLFIVGTNPLRRSRGGRAKLLENLWPKLEKVVVVDFRMSTTALHADIVLPAAMAYERPNLQYAITQTFRLAFSDAAVPPRGDSKSEWEIFRTAVREGRAEVAEREGLDEYLDGRRQTRRLDDLVDAFTSNGAFDQEEAVIDEWIRDSVEAETLPPGTSHRRPAGQGQRPLHRPGDVRPRPVGGRRRRPRQGAHLLPVARREGHARSPP